MKNPLFLLSLFLITLHAYTQEMPDVNQGDNFYEFNQKFYQLNHVDTIYEGGVYGNMYKTGLIWAPRLSPSGYVQPAAQAIVNYAQNYDPEMDTYEVQWTSLGPTGLPDYDMAGTLAGANGVGQIQRIAFDPFYDGDTNKVVYATSSFGGLWRSDDDGEEWYMLNTDLQLPITSVADVVINPNSSDTIFIGTGDNDGGVGLHYGPHTGTIDPIFTCGVFRSTNYGQTWEPINTNLLQYFTEGGTIRKMVINPFNGNQILFAASNGVYRTNNALSANPTWSKVFSGVDTSANEDFRGIAFKPLIDNVVYTSGSDIYKSVDYGDNWVSMTGSTTGLDLDNFPNHFQVRRINIAVTKADTSRLFAYINGSEYIVSGNDTINGSRLFIYKYNGSNWDSLFSYSDYSIGGYNAFQAVSPTWMPITVSPVDANRLVFGHTMVWGTTDLINFEHTGYTSANRHADNHALEFQPVTQNPDLFCGDDGGISFKDETNKDMDKGWEKRVKGLSVNTTWTFDVSELNEDVIVIGSQDCGGFLYTNTGNNWFIYHGGDGYGARIHPIFQGYTFHKSNSSTFLSEYDFFEREYIPISAPVDAGSGGLASAPNTFSLQENFNNRTAELGLTELYDMKTKVFTTMEDTWEVDSDIYKSYPPEQQNEKWRRQITEIAMSPSNPDVIYLVTLGAYNGPDAEWQLPSRLYKSTIGGNNGNLNIQGFDTINFPGDSLNPFPVITGITVNTNDEDEIYLSFSGYMEQYKVWSSIDGGTTWMNEDPTYSLNNLPVNGIEYFNGTNEDYLFIATDAGVYFKSVSDTTWLKYGNIPNVRVTELKILKNKLRIYASTFGRGIWKAPLPENCAEFDTIPIVISSDTTFNSSMTINKSIEIESGATLTISSNIFFADESKIIVKRGGNLVLDKANLSVACDYKSWKGIEVWGTSDSSQYCESCQGTLIAKNSSINSAETGILTAKINAGGFNDEEYSGGIIKMDSSTFANCDVCLKQLNFENFDPSTSLPVDNFSYYNYIVFNGRNRLESATYDGALVEVYGNTGITFSACDFNSEYYFISENGDRFQSLVFLHSSEDIEFLGCTFRNLTSLNHGSESNDRQERGIGLYSYNSNYYIDDLIQEQQVISHSEFQHLYYGVKAIGTDTESAPYITHTKFDNIFRGIYTSGISYAYIIDNNIKSAYSPETYEYPSYGIYLDNSTKYVVTENLFIPYDDTKSQLGIVVNNSGEDNNYIYNNDIRFLNIGILAQDFNRSRDGEEGLTIKCNSFLLNKYDVAVTKTEVDARYKGIKDEQGSDESIDSPAGNRFTSRSFVVLNYDNESDNHIYYYMHDTVTSISAINPYHHTQNNFTRINTAYTYTSEYSCPPIDLERGIDSSKSLLSSSRSMLVQVEDQIESFVDGGDTEGLAGDVVYSIPPEAMDLYSELMAESPYLSDTVIIETARKENVLNATMTRDIMVANPQSAKKMDVMDELYNRTDPIPNDLMTEIENGKNIVDQKELLEAEKSELLLDISLHLNNIIHAYRTNSDSMRDNLDSLFSSENNLYLKYEYIFSLLVQKDTIRAQHVYDSIPVLFELSGLQQTNYQNMGDYLNIYKKSIINNIQWDTTSNMELRNICNLEKGQSSVFARNMLLMHDTFSYNEPILLPLIQEKSSKLINNEPYNKNKLMVEDLFCYPNPAREYVIVGYEFAKDFSNSGHLKLYTINGKLVLTKVLNKSKDQVLIDLRDIDSGEYILKMISSGKVKNTNKLIIVK